MTKFTTIKTRIKDDEFKFVSMSKEDIILNGCIFYFEDEEMHPMVIDEILNINDQWKAFSANGCRYGIDGCYVMRYY